MPIYALGEQEPTIDPLAYVHPDAVVIGSVTIGAESSIWPGAVLRGDDGYITIGERTSIQDGTVVHTTADTPTIVGNGCTVGHVAHLEGCIVHDDSLVGSGAIVLHRAVVSSGALVAANCVVLNDMVIPPGALALGVPAKIKEGAANAEQIRYSADSYAKRAKRFRSDLRRLD